MPPVHYHAGRFPPRNLEWTALIPLLGPATAAVARYDGMLAAAPNSTVLPMALLREREAVMSSRIEGTRATVDDLLLFQVGQSADERRDDVMEVVNYRKAMQRAEEMLQKTSAVPAGCPQRASRPDVRRTRREPGSGRIPPRTKLDWPPQLQNRRGKIRPHRRGQTAGRDGRMGKAHPRGYGKFAGPSRRFARRV